MAKSTHSPADVLTAEQWTAFGVHKITLRTGARVEVRLPDLGLLLAAGRVPERLREGALKRFQGAIEEATAADPEKAALAELEESGAKADDEKAKDESPFNQEVLAELRDLNFWLVEQMLVTPKVTVEQMEAGAIPNEDLELLVDIALRDVDEDAMGVTIGVRRLDEFDTFRDVDPGEAMGTTLQAVESALPDPRVG